jgi:alpha-L-fucosidase
MKADPAAVSRWQDMRFGMFIHWGPVSLTHREIGWSRGAEKTIKMVRQLQPNILINDRTGDGCDFSTPEQHVGSFNMDRPWESCMTISAHGQWAWGGPADGVKSLSDCVLMVVRAAGGNGNVLLNVGPTPEGVIEKCQVERLKEIGHWLAKFGESIYGTRGGPYKPSKSMVSTRKASLSSYQCQHW